MDDFLRLAPARRTALYIESSARLGLSAAAIEKDFWITWTLRELFSLPGLGDHLTFKGGTSLSKGWKLIDRFSEDVDVVVDRAHLGFGGDEIGHSRLKKLRRRARAWIAEALLPLLARRIAEKLGDDAASRLALAPEIDDPDQQTLFFEYPRLDIPGGSYLRPIVRIECGARSETEPSETPTILPLLFDALPDLAKRGELRVRTLAARRTMIEKAMLLHEERQRPAERRRPSRQARHYYDLWCLILRGTGDEVLADSDLFERVAHHRERFWAQSWVDYSTLRRGSLTLLPAEGELQGWRDDYMAMREMIFGEPPDFDDVLAEIERFQSRLNSV
jgi:hypothetical protein